MFTYNKEKLVKGSKWRLRKNPNFIVTVKIVLDNEVFFTNNADIFEDYLPFPLFLLRFEEVL